MADKNLDPAIVTRAAAPLIHDYVRKDCLRIERSKEYQKGIRDFARLLAKQAVDDFLRSELVKLADLALEVKA